MFFITKIGQQFDLPPGLFTATISFIFSQLLDCDGLPSQRNARLFSVNQCFIKNVTQVSSGPEGADFTSPVTQTCDLNLYKREGSVAFPFTAVL